MTAPFIIDEIGGGGIGDGGSGATFTGGGGTTTGGTQPSGPIIQTTIQTNTSEGGNINFAQGVSVGSRGRTVILQATPLDGYEFSNWEVTTFPRAIIPFTLFGYIQKTTEAEICQPTITSQAPAKQVYTDNSYVYFDPDGNDIVPDGYWGAGYNTSGTLTYYYVNNGRPSPLQVCRTTTTGGGTLTGATGGGSTGTSGNTGGTTGASSGNSSIFGG